MDLPLFLEAKKKLILMMMITIFSAENKDRLFGAILFLTDIIIAIYTVVVVLFGSKSSMKSFTAVDRRHSQQVRLTAHAVEATV